MNDRRDILLQILCLANCLSRELGALHSAAGSTGISRTNAHILSYLAEHEDENVFQRDIEEMFSIRRSTVSKIVQLMEVKGLILREAVGHDARLKRLRLTDKARQIHAAASGRYADFESRVTAPLTDEEILTLSTLLDKISISLNPEKDEERL